MYIVFEDHTIFNLAFMQVIDYPEISTEPLKNTLGIEFLADLRRVYEEIYIDSDVSNFQDCCIDIPYNYDLALTGTANAALVEIEPELDDDNRYLNTILFLLLDDSNV